MGGVSVPSMLAENIGTSDVALLDLGLKWVIYQWFGRDMGTVDKGPGGGGHVA